MAVQAIALLDDLDKEVNIYAMRVKVNFFCVSTDTILANISFFFQRNGMAGISPKCLKSLSIMLPMPKPSVLWASEQMPPQRIRVRPS